MPPLPFWTIMLDDLFCTEVIGSMRCSNHAGFKKTKQNKTHFINPLYNSVKKPLRTLKKKKNNNQMFGEDQINFM